MIKQISVGFPFKPPYGCFGYSSVLLVNDDKNILFDVGGYNLRKEIIKILDEIDIIVISHLHFDHCSNLDLFISSNKPIYISKKELDYFESNKNNDPDLFSYFDNIKDKLNIIEVSREKTISKNTKIVFTPGHTPGHISLEVKNENNVILLAGDSIKSFKDYSNDNEYSNAFDKEKCLKTKQNIKKKYNIIYPGHSSAIINGCEEKKIEIKEF